MSLALARNGNFQPAAVLMKHLLLIHAVGLTLLGASLAAADGGAAEGGFVEPPEDQYAVAAGHYADQRWDLAEEEFRTFLANYPDHPQAGAARFYLAEALVQLGRFQKARDSFRRLLDEHPESRFARQSLFRSGETAYLSGDFKAAKADLEKFREQYPGDDLNAFVLPYLGEMALVADDVQSAQEHFTQALNKFPGGLLKDDCRLGLAKALEKQQRLIEAERLYRKLAEDRENTLADRAQFRLGLLYYRGGKHDNALEIWKSFDEQFPDSAIRPSVELGRGWALYRLERYAEAQERLAALVQNDKVGIEAQYWLGLTLRAQDQWRRAAETLIAAGNAASEHELSPAIHFHAGDSLLHVGDREAAARQFDWVLEHRPESDWADDCLFGKLQAAYQAANHGDVERLASEYQQRFADGPLTSDTYLLRASALKALDRDAEAAEDLEKYLLRNPNTPQAPQARAELVACYVRLRMLDQAKEAYRKLVDAFPDHELVLPATHQLAEATYARGDRAFSSSLFEKMASAEKEPEHVAQGLAGLAWNKLNANDLDGAAELFGRLLKEHPRDSLAPEAALTRGQIFEQQGKTEPALTMYHLVVQEYDESRELAEALLRAARIHDRLQQDQQAATLYERLVNNFPEFEQLDAALYGWAWVLYDLEQFERGDELFQRLHDELAESKYWADATYRLAQRAAKQKEYERASALLTKLVASEPDDEILAHALYLQGRIAARRELWEEVERPMRALIERLPESPLRLAAEYSVAEAAFRREDYRRAGRLLDSLTERIAGRDEAWLAMIPLRRAQVHVYHKEWDAALAITEQLVEDFPNFSRQYEVDYIRGRCLAAQGKFADAREAYRAVIRSPEGSKTETAAMAQWMIGETYFHQKNYQQARREFLRTEILYGYPKWQAGALLEAGKCHELMAQWEEAAETYLRLVKRYPESEFTEEATRRLRVAEQRAARPAIQ